MKLRCEGCEGRSVDLEQLPVADLTTIAWVKSSHSFVIFGVGEPIACLFDYTVVWYYGVEMIPISCTADQCYGRGEGKCYLSDFDAVYAYAGGWGECFSCHWPTWYGELESLALKTLDTKAQIILLLFPFHYL